MQLNFALTLFSVYIVFHFSLVLPFSRIASQQLAKCSDAIQLTTFTQSTHLHNASKSTAKDILRHFSEWNSMSLYSGVSFMSKFLYNLAEQLTNGTQIIYESQTVIYLMRIIHIQQNYCCYNLYSWICFHPVILWFFVLCLFRFPCCCFRWQWMLWLVWSFGWFNLRAMHNIKSYHDEYFLKTLKA